MNEIIYAGSYVITGKINEKSTKLTNRRVKGNPRWWEKIEKEIYELGRYEGSILDWLIRAVKVKLRILNKMKKKYKMKKLDNLASLTDTLKQKIQLKVQIMRRYEKRTKFYRQKNTCKTEKKKS